MARAVRNPLTDALHLKRADFGISVHAALAEIARAGRGAVVILSEPATPDELLERLRSGGHPPEKPAGEWRRHGLGAQILRDLGISSIRLLATRSRQYIGLGGFGITIAATEVIDT